MPEENAMFTKQEINFKKKQQKGWLQVNYFLIIIIRKGLTLSESRHTRATLTVQVEVYPIQAVRQVLVDGVRVHCNSGGWGTGNRSWSVEQSLKETE